MRRIPQEHLEFAKSLRMQMTDAETLMWHLLRNRRFGGFKFRRQYALAPFILDFYCAERSLAIELDGGQHAKDAKRDEQRSEWLIRRGLTVVRVWNHDLLERTETVLEALWDQLHLPSP
jgi:very-short-patch-repair endonuclease